MFPAEPFTTLGDVEAHIGGETVQCLLCGKKFEIVLSHVLRTHEMAEREYRDLFNIPAKFSLAGSRLSEKRRSVGKRPEHAAHIAKQRAKLPRTGKMNAMVVAVRPKGKERYEDFSWHLQEARTVYERAQPPQGIPSWSTFQKRLVQDAELRDAFKQARAARPVDPATEYARLRRTRRLTTPRDKDCPSPKGRRRLGDVF